jgi:hypothetical protein
MFVPQWHTYTPILSVINTSLVGFSFEKECDGIVLKDHKDN